MRDALLSSFLPALLQSMSPLGALFLQLSMNLIELFLGKSMYFSRVLQIFDEVLKRISSTLSFHLLNNVI